MNWNSKDEKKWMKNPITGEILPFPEEDNKESERYWSVKTHYTSLDGLFNGFKSGISWGLAGSTQSGKAPQP